MNGIKVAIVGVGNVASALIQGVEYYKNAKTEEETAGLSYPDYFAITRRRICSRHGNQCLGQRRNLLEDADRTGIRDPS